MSRLFLNADDDKLALDLGVGNEINYPISIFCWVKSDNEWSTNADTIASLHTTDGSNDYRIGLSNSATADRLSATASTTTSSADAYEDFTIAADTWLPVLGVWASATDRKIYLNYPREGGVNNGTVSKVIADFRYLTIGELPAGTNGHDGAIAELCVWTKALTADDFDLLVTAAETGKAPGGLYVSDVVDYWPMSTSSLVGSVNGLTLTETGSATYDADHPTITGWSVKKLKLLAHPSAVGASSIEGVVLDAARDTVIGEFSGQAFIDGDGESPQVNPGYAVLKVAATDISPDGSTLTTSDTPLAIAYNATYSTPLVACTVIEE